MGANCKNNDQAETVRCTVQVSGLPAACTAQAAGGPVLSGGGFLVSNTSAYGAKQTKTLDFKLTTTCSPNLPPGIVATLQLKACADGGFLDPDTCVDTDIVPAKAPNLIVKPVKLHR